MPAEVEDIAIGKVKRLVCDSGDLATPKECWRDGLYPRGTQYARGAEG